MRFIIVLSLFFLSFNAAQAQQFNNFSLELGGGSSFSFQSKRFKRSDKPFQLYFYETVSGFGAVYVQ